MTIPAPPSQKSEVSKAKTDMGRRLIELREHKGLDRKAVAAATTIHYNTIQAYEMRADVNPELNKIRSLANLYDCTIDYIVEGARPTSINAPPSPADRVKKTREEHVRALSETTGVDLDQVRIIEVINPIGPAQIGGVI